jgi:methionyl-tRNA formyltransferase
MLIFNESTLDDLIKVIRVHEIQVYLVIILSNKWGFSAMTVSKLRVILITMGVSNIMNSLLETSINTVGVIESKQRKSNVFNKELKEYCLEMGIPYYFMNEGCNAQLENWVRELEPDLIVTYKMSELLGKNILDIPNKGSINLHFSLLPKYRGSHPIFWTFYNYDLNPGVTVHYLDEGEDTGNIIYQESYNLPVGSTEEDLIHLSSIIGIQLLLKSIADIENNCEPQMCQPKKSPTERARQIKPDEYQKIVEWENWELERTWHLLRGTQNWLNVFDFSNIKGKISKWRILQYTKQDIKPQLTVGKVYKEADNFYVYCGLGLIYMEILMEAEGLFLSLTLLKNIVYNLI